MDIIKVTPKTILCSVEICLFKNKGRQVIQTSIAFKCEEETWGFWQIEQNLNFQITFVWHDEFRSAFAFQRINFCFNFFFGGSVQVWVCCDCLP